MKWLLLLVAFRAHARKGKVPNERRSVESSGTYPGMENGTDSSELWHLFKNLSCKIVFILNNSYSGKNNGETFKLNLVNKITLSGIYNNSRWLNKVAFNVWVFNYFRGYANELKTINITDSYTRRTKATRSFMLWS